MHEISAVGPTLITLGVLLLLGLATDAIGRRTRLPRVTLLLIFGFVIGPEALDLLPPASATWFPLVATTALVMVGFLLGEKLALATLRQYGRRVLWISAAVVVTTVVAVLVGLVALGLPVDVALLLAAIATATAPAATADVVREAEAEGPFTTTLLGIVAIDDAWGLGVFSLMFALAQVLRGGGSALGALATGAWDIGGAAALGLALGVPLAFLTGRIQPGEPTLAEALGAVLFCGGLALWLDVSFLLASMVLGAVVANLARHHARPFHAIEGIEWPFMILFFVLAGATARMTSLAAIGAVGTAYIVLRIAGRVIGAWIGGAASRTEPGHSRWTGVALMPQAGVALGMALVAAQGFPVFADTILPVVVGTTVFFELVGPPLTRLALEHVGETRPRPGR